MTELDDDNSGRRGRRGLLNPQVQRGAVARYAIRAIRAGQRVVMLAAEVLLAAIILFEEWGWQPLAAALAALRRFRIVARLEAAVEALPPYGALAVFLVPSILFLPLKLASLALIASGHIVWATILFAFAKVAGTALYARIFQLTRPALMRLAWFARAYNWFMPWKEAIVAHAKATAVWRNTAALAKRVKAAARDVVARLRPIALAAWRRLRARMGM